MFGKLRCSLILKFVFPQIEISIIFNLFILLTRNQNILVLFGVFCGVEQVVQLANNECTPPPPMRYRHGQNKHAIDWCYEYIS
jgi:hypothetical protein